MSRVYYLFPIALIASLLISLMPKPAAAAGMPGQHGISCKAGICTLAIDLNGDGETNTNTGLLSFALPKDLGFVPAGSQFSLTDDMLLSLPIGDIPLENTSLTIQLDNDNRVERLNGSAALTLPSVNIFGYDQASKQVEADLGLDLGKNLAFDVPLDPERSYLYLHVDSGFELEAGLKPQDGRDQYFRLVVPQGKQATLIIDPQEPFLYLSGDFDIHYNGELFFLRQVLDPTALPLPLDILPLGQHATLHVSGSLGRDLDRASLEIGAGYAFDQGIVGRWVNLEATPLSVEGLLTVSPDGVALNGLTRSRIQPDLLFNGELLIEAFIPFKDVLQNTYVQLEGSATIPLAQVDVQKAARMNTDKVLTWIEPVDGIVDEWVDTIPSIYGDAEWLLKARSASRQGLGWANSTTTHSYQSLKNILSDESEIPPTR